MTSDILLNALDDSQKNAGLAIGHSLVLAGPGSGKTRLLSAKANYLIQKHQTGSLVAVSFTRDSAMEINERIGINDTGRVLTGTFHSLALRQIKPVTKDRILDDAGRIHYIMQAIDETGINLPIEDASLAIDTYKSTLTPPPSNGEEVEVFRAYQDLIKKHRLIDFQDILRNAVLWMRTKKIKPLQARWMLVDEAQDLDDVQYAWVMEHIKNGSEVTLVADDDQSIYGWRHALGYLGLTRFEKEAQAKRYVLTGNYRCVPEIVSISQELISHNNNRFEKKIFAKRTSLNANQPLLISAFENDYKEADSVVQAIKKNPNGEWGILSRTNRKLDLIELACSFHQIKINRLGGRSFWDRPPSSAVLALMEDLSKNDILSGVARFARFAKDVTKEDITLLSNNEKPTHKGLAILLKHLPDWSQNAKHEDRVNLTLRAMIIWADKNIEKRYKSIVLSALSHIKKLHGSIGKRIAFIRRSQKEIDSHKESNVMLASMHSSKGLEWENVWIIGCEDGTIPHTDSPIEEERRLFYVGITRAKNNLTISHVLSDSSVPSRFISEIDK